MKRVQSYSRRQCASNWSLCAASRSVCRATPLSFGLCYELVSRASSDVQLRLLQQVMEEQGFVDEFPFVLPVARRLLDVRVLLAHSVEIEWQAAGGDHGPQVVFWSYRRGRASEKTVPVSQLTWLVHSAAAVTDDLHQIWFRCISEDQLAAMDRQFDR